MQKYKKPLSVVTALYLLLYAVRAVEYFVIRTDRTMFGEAFIHKLVGILIMLAALKAFSYKTRDIGFTSKQVGKYNVYGLLLGAFTFAIAYGVEIAIAMAQGNFKSVNLYVTSYAVDGNIGNQTAIIYFVFCIVGNIINVVMEEGVFRGLFQKLLEKKYTFMSSAVIASALFGFWHMIAPLRSYLDGASSFNGMIANILMLVITSGLVGFKFALITKLTGSLYMAMSDHFINNTIVNLLHITSHTGADELMFVRITIAQITSFVIVLMYYFKSKKRAHTVKKTAQA